MFLRDLAELVFIVYIVTGFSCNQMPSKDKNYFCCACEEIYVLFHSSIFFISMQIFAEYQFLKNSQNRFNKFFFNFKYLKFFYLEEWYNFIEFNMTW